MHQLYEVLGVLVVVVKRLEDLICNNELAVFPRNRRTVRCPWSKRGNTRATAARQSSSCFAERYQVIAIDLGGHGESGLGRVDWNLAAFGDDVVAVVDEIGANSVALVGHSMGGDAVVHAARRLGDRVIGLVWVDVLRSLGNETVSSPEEVEAFIAPFRDDFAAAVDRFVRRLLPETVDSRLVDRISTDMAATSREVALGSLPYARNRQPAILAALPHIAAPIVAINPATAPTDVASLRRHGVEPILVEDVGHFPMIEAPDQFNAVLGAALASFDS